MRDVRYYSARNDELQKENDAIMDILSKHGFDGDKEIVRLVKRNLTLTKENEKLLSRMETMEGVIKLGADKINEVPDFMTDPETIPDGIADAVIGKCYEIENELREALTNKDGK